MGGLVGPLGGTVGQRGSRSDGRDDRSNAEGEGLIYRAKRASRPSAAAASTAPLLRGERFQAASFSVRPAEARLPRTPHAEAGPCGCERGGRVLFGTTPAAQAAEAAEAMKRGRLTFPALAVSSLSTLAEKEKRKKRGRRSLFL